MWFQVMHVGTDVHTLLLLTGNSIVKQTHPTALNAEGCLKMVFAIIAEGKAIHRLSHPDVSLG